MSEDQTPFDRGEPANDELDWVIVVKEDGVYLHWPAEDKLVNLGPCDLVFTAWADKMGEVDFGEGSCRASG